MTDSRTAEKFVIRLPDGLRDKYRDMAKRNGRSMNSEMVRALEAGLEAVDELIDMEVRLSVLEDTIDALRTTK